MKHKLIVFFFAFSLALSACGGSAVPEVPTQSAADVAGTAQVMAQTVIAQTQQAIPSNTALPPTEAASPTPFPTDTPIPSPTLDPLLATSTFTLEPTFTLQAAATQATDCNKLLSSWQVPTAKLIVENETKPKGKLTLSMYVQTSLGECGYIVAYEGTFPGPVGNYSAAAYVDGKKDFKVFGGFHIGEGGWSIIIRNDVIVAKGGCYPNC